MNDRGRTRARGTHNWAIALGTLLPLFLADLAHAEESAFGSSNGTVPRVTDPLNGRHNGDGIYGRMNGDVSLRGAVGIEADLGTKTVRPAAVGHFLVYQTAGLYASYRESVEADDPIERIFSFGAIVSPLFLWRWSNDKEWGLATADLALDSLGLVAGAHFSQPDTRSFGSAPGLELGLIFGVPLMQQANGLWLRGRAQMMTGRSSYADDPLAASFLLTLGWEGFVYTGLLKN